MKHKVLLSSSVVVGLMAAFVSGCATSQERLQAQANISKADAEKIALAKVPGGTITEGELEKEKGKLVWSFDISTPGTRDITEVLVDAKSGEIISTEKETPAQQEKEKQDKPKEKTDKSWQENVATAHESFTTTGRNRYFILEPGYQLVLEGKEGGKTVNLTITVLGETKRIGETETRIIEERETADGKLTEISRNYFAVGAQSHNVYYFGEDVDVYKGDKIVHEGAWLTGIKGAQFGLMMPGEIQVGAKYYQEKAPKVAMDRAENVSTNEMAKTVAGTFQNCLKVKETTPLEPGNVEYKLYAPEVGLVQEGGLRLVKYGFVNK